MDIDAGEKDRRFVNALAQGLQILRAFEPDGRVLSLEALSALTGLSKQAVIRLTGTLTEQNCLVKDRRDGAFSLAPGALSLGYSVMANADLGDRASHSLAGLARSVGGVATLGKLDLDQVVYMRVYKSDATVSVQTHVGSKVSAATSACGRAIIAGASSATRQEIFDSVRAERSADVAKALEAAADDAIEEYERYGFCTSIGSWSPDVNAVAAPVRCFDCNTVLAFGLSAPAYFEPAETWLEIHGPAIAETARLMSAPDTDQSVD